MIRILPGVLLAAVLTACATTPDPRTDTATAKAAPPNCITDTATRIPVQPGQCSASPGRVYSGEDMQRTGQTDAARALRMLDPAITTPH